MNSLSKIILIALGVIAILVGYVSCGLADGKPPEPVKLSPKKVMDMGMKKIEVVQLDLSLIHI